MTLLTSKGPLGLPGTSVLKTNTSYVKKKCYFKFSITVSMSYYEHKQVNSKHNRNDFKIKLSSAKFKNHCAETTKKKGKV